MTNIGMERREFLVVAATGPVAGCLSDEETEASPATTGSVDTTAEGRVVECERQYIKNEVVTGDDETISDPLDPEVINAESRSDGKYVELETQFGTVRSFEGEPDEHVDHLVTAYYLVSDDEVYRTEDAESDPRNGTTVDC